MDAANGRRSPRSRAKLETAVEMAETAPERAVAHFELAVFHDNNSREAEAIPHYEAALQLGLAGEQRAQCLAWLASSLYKTRKWDRARRRIQEARDASPGGDLLTFIDQLERRLNRDETMAMMQKVGRLLMRQARRKT